MNVDDILGLGKKSTPAAEGPSLTIEPTLDIGIVTPPKPPKVNLTAAFEDKGNFEKTASSLHMQLARADFNKRIRIMSLQIDREFEAGLLEPSAGEWGATDEPRPEGLEWLVAKLISPFCFTKEPIKHKTRKVAMQLIELHKARKALERLDAAGWELVRKSPDA